jgi:hypothetical protein
MKQAHRISLLFGGLLCSTCSREPVIYSPVEEIGTLAIERGGLDLVDPEIGRILVTVEDGGGKYRANGRFDFGDGLEFTTASTSCYYVSGWGYLDLVQYGLTRSFDKYKQSDQGLAPCHQLANSIEELLKASP